MRFYAPKLQYKVVCHKCKACIHACPAKALSWGVGEIIVNLRKCAEEWIKTGECIQCAAECHQAAIVLEEYRLEGNEVKKIQRD